MNLKKSLKRLRKSAKAVSPILAVLFMIVVSVAAGLVTYAWVMGYLDFTTSKAGKAVQIQSIAYDSDTEILYVYVQNVGDGAIEFIEGECYYANGFLQTGATVDPTVLMEEETATATTTYPMLVGQDVLVRITTVDGTFNEAGFTYEGEGNGGVVAPPPTVTRELATEASFSGVVAGDLLVVIANTRTGSYTTGALTASCAGYAPIQVASFYTGTGDRRAVALFYRVADGTESGTAPTVSWTGSGVTTYEILYQVFRMTDGTNTWTPIANGANHGTSPEVNTLTVPSAALPGGSTANVLSIGAMVMRDNPGTPSFTGLAGLVLFDSGGAYSSTAYNYGLPVTQTIVTWPTIQRASGLLVQIACS